MFDNLGNELCAPVFMFCMGVSFCYSRNQNPRLMAVRGLRIFIMAYALNIVRGVIPELIAGLLGVNPLSDGLLEHLLMVDILQFAGLAMIAIALCKKLKLHPAVIFSFGILFATISDFLEGLSTGSFVLDQILGLIYPISEYTCFSFLAWFIFPASGLFFGMMLMRCTDRRKLYSALLPVSGLITICVHIGSIVVPGYYTGDLYYAMGVKPSILAFYVAFFMLSCGHFAEKHIPAPLMKITQKMSSNLNEIYIISWVLILWVLLLTRGVLKVELPIWGTVILMVVLLIASYLLAIKFKELKKKKKATAK